MKFWEDTAEMTGISFRDRLRSRAPMICGFIAAPSPDLVEVAHYAGFDFVVVDAEHGPITIGDICHMIRAGQSVGIPVLVRVPEPTKDFILRSLDAGASGIVAPEIETAEEAAALVAATHYPPAGHRGAAHYSRIYGYSKHAGFAALQAADAGVVTGVNIETPLGVENAESIMSVPGIDLILPGPSDYRVKLGEGPETGRKVEETMQALGRLGLKHGVAMGMAAPNVAEGKRFAAQGYSILLTGLLPLLLRNGTEYVKGCREALMSAQAEAAA